MDNIDIMLEIMGISSECQNKMREYQKELYNFTFIIGNPTAAQLIIGWWNEAYAQSQDNFDYVANQMAMYISNNLGGILRKKPE